VILDGISNADNKKWNFIDKGYSFILIIVSILTLFVCKAFFNSSYISNNPGFPPTVTKRIVIIINALFVIITIIVLISIPFIWYGTIEELAGH